MPRFLIRYSPSSHGLATKWQLKEKIYRVANFPRCYLFCRLKKFGCFGSSSRRQSLVCPFATCHRSHSKGTPSLVLSRDNRSLRFSRIYAIASAASFFPFWNVEHTKSHSTSCYKKTVGKKMKQGVTYRLNKDSTLVARTRDENEKPKRE